jgi:BirA family biotin operon repressor/biotin-[acetyl-CoA-carboxylase] ligase
MATPRAVFQSLDSTNAEALRRAASGERGPLWLLAYAQSAARGRRGRAWSMPSGNFAASLLLPVAGGPSQAALRSFTAALALHDVLRVLAPGAELGLKWPNDVLLGGRKLAGILLETAPGSLLVIGIGVNLAAVPGPEDLEEGAVPPVSLAEITGRALAPEAFLDRLDRAFFAREAELAERGFSALRRDWLARAERLGEEITARLPGGPVRGIFTTIDEDGQLVMQSGQDIRRIPAAEISF